MTRGTWRLLAVAVAVAVPLGACAALPSSGPVTSAVPPAGVYAPLAQHAEGPRDGAGPRQIIEGFQRACTAGVYDNFKVARQFLTKTARQSWNPEESTTVLDEDIGDNLSVQVTDDSHTVEVSGLVLLAVDAYGRETRSASMYRESFGLVKENGQWRIDRLRDGVTMTRSAFANAYTRRNVYFLSASDAMPVADPRWVARHDLVVNLVKALYQGPVAQIGSAATTAIPAGAAQQDPIVDVSGAMATVTVPRQIGELSSGTLTQAAWQIALTLEGVSGISRVELVYNHRQLPLADLPQPPDYDLDYFVGVKDGAIVRFTDARPQTLLPASALKGRHPRWPAAGPVADQPVVFMADDGKSLLLSSNQQVRTLLTAEKLTRPSIDRYGYVWTSNPDDGSIPIVVTPEGDVAELTVPWGPEDRVGRVALNSDGTRALVWRYTDSRDYVAVYTVRRVDGVPVELEPGQAIAAPITSVADIGWVDVTTPIVLAGGADRSVVVSPINGMEDIYAAPPDAVALVAGGTNADVQVLSSDSHRYRRVGRQWRAVGSGIADVAHAG